MLRGDSWVGTERGLGRAGRACRLLSAFPTLVLVFSSKPKDESLGSQGIYSMDGQTIPKRRRSGAFPVLVLTDCMGEIKLSWGSSEISGNAAFQARFPKLLLLM